MTWVELLRKMRLELKTKGFDQVPQLTSSRMVDVNERMYVVPEGSTGRRRALLIGINYSGPNGECGDLSYRFQFSKVATNREIFLDLQV